MARPAILVRTRHDEGVDWRRFAASLCFIEFYCKFVTSGSDLWRLLHPRFLSRVTFDPTQSVYLIELCFEVLRATALFFIGRALWRRIGNVRFWTAGAIVTSIAAVSACAARVWAGQDPYFGTWGIVGFGPKAWGVFTQQLDQLVWLVVLIVSLVLRRRLPAACPVMNGWVIVAIGWCLARLVADCVVVFPHPGAPYAYLRYTGLSDWIAGGLRPIFNEPKWMVPVTMLAPLLLAALLLLRSHLARPAALVVACLDTTPIVIHGITWPLLIAASIQALIYSLPRPVENPFPVPWIFLNRDTFITLCVELVGIVGPWLVIARYARRNPMTDLPDDGSPWPRRYCGKCFYNLHGVEAERCPECGTQLVDQGRSALTGSSPD